MFEIKGNYSNRIGKYTVLALMPPRMRVRYEDGTETELKIDVQERIWANIVAEQEAKAASRISRRGMSNAHYIKAVSVAAPGELVFPGWQERVVLAGSSEQANRVNPGDRLIYYAIETQTFFAVATITGPAFEANPKDYFFTTEAQSLFFLPVDVDAAAFTLENGLSVDGVELESIPNFRKMRLEAESFHRISEDDFELVAELLTEVSEDESEEMEEEEEEYFEPEEEE